MKSKLLYPTLSDRLVHGGNAVEQVAVFSTVNDPDGLQQTINSWLTEMKGKIEVLQRSVVATGRMDHHVSVIYHYRLLEEAPV
jgi:hypothetical protein